jgi:hypothetical protein
MLCASFGNLYDGFDITDMGQKSGLKWYKGNTHTHSYWSDGDDFPEMIMDWYKSHGYDFISLSDHNTLAKAKSGNKFRDILSDSEV